MPRKKVVQPTEGHFGVRLAALRQKAGLSQRTFAQLVGSSQRMIGYYETRAALPLGHVLASLAKALGLTVDELVGAKTATKPTRGMRLSPHLARRLALMEKLPMKDKREIFSIIDTYLAKNHITDDRP